MLRRCPQFRFRAPVRCVGRIRIFHVTSARLRRVTIQFLPLAAMLLRVRQSGRDHVRIVRQIDAFHLRGMRRAIAGITPEALLFVRPAIP